MKKLKDTKAMIGDRDIDIQVDGGVNLNNAKDIILAGANVLVAGSAVFGKNTLEQCKAFQNLFENIKQSV